MEIIRSKMQDGDFNKYNFMLYREDTRVIAKLFDMMQLFVNVNSQLDYQSKVISEAT